MALTIKVLAFNQLPTSAGSPLYSPASIKVAIVKAWRFTNTGSSAVTINAYFQKNGGTFNSSNARRLLAKDLSLAPGYTAIDDLELTLGAGDGIYATVSSGGTVDYVVSGVERDA